MITPFDRWRNETLQDVWDFVSVVDWSVKDLAKHAKLAPATIYRLRSRKTREPRASTLFKLARSLGLSLNVVETKVKAKKKLVA